MLSITILKSTVFGKSLTDNNPHTHTQSKTNVFEVPTERTTD